MNQFIKKEPIFVETLLNWLHVDDVNAGTSSVETGYNFYLKAKQRYSEGCLIFESFAQIHVHLNKYLIKSCKKIFQITFAN